LSSWSNAEIGWTPVRSPVNHLAGQAGVVVDQQGMAVLLVDDHHGAGEWGWLARAVARRRSRATAVDGAVGLTGVASPPSR